MSAPAHAPIDEADYFRRGAWRRSPLGHHLWQWADTYGPSTAVVDAATRLSYDELARRSDLMAQALLDHRLAEGDAVLIQLPNSWEFLAVLLGCQRVGVRAVMALMSFRQHELTRIARTSGAKAIVVTDRFRDEDHQHIAQSVATAADFTCPPLVVGTRVAAENIDLRPKLLGARHTGPLRRQLDRRSPDPAAGAVVLCSGGTTGEPKLVQHTHADYEHAFRNCAQVAGVTQNTRYLAVLPVAHNFSLASPGALGVLASGGTVVMAASPAPESALPLIEKEKITMTAIVPAVAKRWLAHLDDAPTSRPDLSTLAVVQIGGAVTPPDLAKRVGVRFGATVQQVYGMSEGLVSMTRLDDPLDVVNATQGRPVSGFDKIRIVDATGTDVPDGTVGELIARGASMAAGYLGHSSGRSDKTPDGWHRTGDLVRWHPSGNLVVVGRLKELVNRGGEKIAVTEVETILCAMDGVSDAVAFAWPHPELGECVAAAIILTQQRLRPPSVDAVKQHFRDSGVATQKAPDELFTVSSFPLTAMGKIDRNRLRDQLLDQTRFRTRHSD